MVLDESVFIWVSRSGLIRFGSTRLEYDQPDNLLGPFKLNLGSWVAIACT